MVQLITEGTGLIFIVFPMIFNIMGAMGRILAPLLFLAILFAMIGVAVGLGNIWRFSYVVYTNGGGTFFIPYLVAIALMGIPFLILEYGIGFSFKKSFTEIMKSIRPQ